MTKHQEQILEASKELIRCSVICEREQVGEMTGLLCGYLLYIPKENSNQRTQLDLNAEYEE